MNTPRENARNREEMVRDTFLTVTRVVWGMKTKRKRSGGNRKTGRVQRGGEKENQGEADIQIIDIVMFL